MTNRSLNRPSSLLLVAAVALVLGSTGGAVAGSLVTSADIKNGTVSSKDLKNNTIKSTDISSGAAARVSGYGIVSAYKDVDPSAQDVNVAASCTGGRRILGASGYWVGTDHAPQVFIGPGGSGAIAYSDNTLSEGDRLYLQLVCAKVSTAGSLRNSLRPHK